MPPTLIDADLFPPDIREFICLLHKHRVDYMIVGGEAVIYYGYARLTGDVDFFFRDDQDNAFRLFSALNEFWNGNIPGISHCKELTTPGLILQFGRPPNRIDLINRIDGVIFQEAWPDREITEMQSNEKAIPIIYIGKKNLIANKHAAGRPKDLDDLSYLEATVSHKKTE